MIDRPQRIQLSRRKGWKMPADTRKVDRSTRWGNPYRGEDPAKAVAAFRGWLLWQPPQPRLVLRDPPRVTEIVAELRGKNLACWCRLDAPCHADVLLELANAR